MKMKEIKKLVGIWLLGGIATIIVLAALTGITVKDHGWIGYLALAVDGNIGEGKITRTEPNNHCRAEYFFVLGGHNYSGIGSDCTAKIGQEVMITYLPANPSHSCLGLARESLTNEVMTFVIGGIIFPPFLMLAYRARKKKKLDNKGNA